MKKFLLALVVLTGAAFSSFAQSEDGGKFSIGVEAGLPLGDVKEGTNLVIGGSVKYEHPIAENLFATISAGYNSFLFKSEYKDAAKALGLPTSISAIPVKAGLKYYFSEGFFGEAQAGAAFGTQKGQGTAFAYAPGIGYTFAGGFEAGVRYESWSKDGSTNQVGLRLAYRF